MFQQAIAIIIIVFLLIRLFVQKRRGLVPGGEFALWLIFWLLALAVILSIKWIDRVVAGLGFSGSGIEVLLYLGVVVLFYAIFRLRLKMEKIEKNITTIVREISKNNTKK
jgi:hypothetical protein